jgi:hypothetical protein
MGGGRICTDDISKKKDPLSSLSHQGFAEGEEGVLILSGNHLRSSQSPSAIRQSGTNA